MKTAQLLAEVGQPNSMVDYSIRPVIVRIRTPNNTNHRNIFRVSPGDGVDDAESADGERHDARADANAAGSGETVCGIAGVELVAAADVAEPGLGG